MPARIVVYSLTGRTRRLAQRLAEETGMPVSEIRCPRYRGVFGVARALWDMAKGHSPQIEVVPPIGAALAIVVGGPVWFGRLAPPMRVLLGQARRLPPVVGVILTRAHPGSSYRIEQGIEALLRGGGTPAPERLVLQSRDVTLPRARDRIRAFADLLRRRLLPPTAANAPDRPAPRVTRRGAAG